jgi:hypothetical protein
MIQSTLPILPSTTTSQPNPTTTTSTTTSSTSTTHQITPRELCCPITQELLRDPVIAEDGQSYEAVAIRQWFINNTRSPVTNEELPSKILIPNHALRRIIEHHRATLGNELLTLCCSSSNNNITESDIMQYIDKSADLDVRDPSTGNTSLHFLVTKDRLPLIEILIRAGADATIMNEKGETPCTIAKRRRLSPELITLLEEAAKNTLERRAWEERNKERRREEQRRMQQQLQRSASGSNGSSSSSRGNNNNTTPTTTHNNNNGLGNVPIVAGTGFFPSLFGLQFQGALEPARANIPGVTTTTTTTMMSPSTSSSTGILTTTNSNNPTHMIRQLIHIRLTIIASWLRSAFVGREITPEDERQVQFLSRVLLALGSAVLLCLIVL